MTRMNKLLPEEANLFNAGLFTEFMQQRGPGHTVADGKIYKYGYKDFIKQIEEEIANLDYNNDMEALNKRAELEGMKLVCEGMCILGERYAKLARELAEKNRPQWR